MAQRHLRQLLREKQEPFVLESFIEERRGQLRHRHELKRRVPLPLSKNPTFSSNPSQSPSFISKRSPIFDVAVKTPSFGLKPVAYLIIEAALRIQEKQRKNKRGNSIKALSFGFFGSILKRLALRKGRREIDTEEIKVFGGTRPGKKEYGEEGVHEEKETQFSPVSVLDPSSFAEEDEDDHHPEHSNAQRTRHKLRRLESLAAGLVPIELDQLLALEQDNENVTDITDEERQMLRSCKLDGNGLLERMCARFEAWKEAGDCTIDMMVELDFRHDGGEWKRCEEQVPEIAAGIEISIFEFLVSELFDELVL